MKERFENRTLDGNISIKLDTRTWSADKRSIVNAITSIVSNYEAQGYKLTLRQLYYQLVAADAIPNHDKVYKKIGGILDDCRYSGNLDWDSIEDRGRVPKLPYSVEGIADALKDTVDGYRLNRQEGQPKTIELWTEKDAISNILYRVTAKYHVRLVVNKGYTSSSAMYQAYERFVESLNEGKPVVILYFGDHDPSGLDMVRDIEDRLLTFFCNGSALRDSPFLDKVNQWWDHYGYSGSDLPLTEREERILDNEDGDRSEQTDIWESAQIKMFIKEKELFSVVPIGLKMEQIKKYNLPHNPAKITDPRAAGYIKNFGQKSWEVDALRPDVLTSIVDSNIVDLLDTDVWNEVIAREKKEKAEILKFANKY